MKASVRFLQHFRLHSRTVSVPDSHIGHIPYVWLRDACQCPRCVHPSTRQKLFQTSDVPIDVKPAEDQRGLLLQKDELGLRWMDRYVSTWSMDFLEKYRNAAAREDLHHDSNTQPIRWDKRMARSSRDLFLPYSALSKDSGRLAAFRQLKQYGLLFVCGVPNEHASDEHCELRTLASLFGQIRHTFYGQVWDVKAIKDSKNIAYTDLNLGMHMDLLYFQHPPRYQFLHCLRNRVRGGTSLFVDSFHAAASLPSSHFATLAETPVPFHYMNNSHHLHQSHPTLELDPLQSKLGNTIDALAHVNYSPPFQAPLHMDTPAEFYDALKAFSDELDKPANVLRHRLQEGETVIFDNRRVLHARTAFGAAADRNEPEVQARDKENDGLDQGVKEGESERWLKGCYIEADALEDRRRILENQREEKIL